MFLPEGLNKSSFTPASTSLQLNTPAKLQLSVLSVPCGCLTLISLACLQPSLRQASHLFSQNPTTNTENSAQSRSEHIFMELTLFVYNINSQYFCIKSGLNYLRYKRYDKNETEGHIFFYNLYFHSNGIYILYINCYHHRKIYFLH